MNFKLKKLALKLELLIISIEEMKQEEKACEELFIKDFREELDYLKSQVTQVETNNTNNERTHESCLNEIVASKGDNAESDKADDISLKEIIKPLYKKLVISLHPDVSKDENSNEIFSKIAVAWENMNVYDLLMEAMKADIDIGELYKGNEKHLKQLIESLRDMQVNIESKKRKVMWVWYSSDKSNNTRELLYRYLNINKNNFHAWKEKSKNDY